MKIKICVSGAAETGHCGIDALEIGKEVGKEIVRQGAILVTGATTGFPMWAAMGAKEEEGISIGISPAQTELEHVEKYKLPLEYMDLIMYNRSRLFRQKFAIDQNFRCGYRRLRENRDA